MKIGSSVTAGVVANALQEGYPADIVVPSMDGNAVFPTLAITLPGMLKELLKSIGPNI